MDPAGFHMHPSNRDDGSSIITPSVHEDDFLDSMLFSCFENCNFVQKRVAYVDTFYIDIDG